MNTSISSSAIDDTDLDVLVVALARTLEEEAKEWASFGTGKVLRFLEAHEMAWALDLEKAQALLIFHASMGCHTVSCFAWHAKSTALCGQLYLSWPRQSLISLLRRIILMKMLCTPSRGSTSWFTTKQAPQWTSIRRAANCLGRRVMSIWSHRQLQPWSSTYDKKYSRADMAGIRRRHCHHQPTGAGSRPAIYTNLSGHRCPKYQSSAGILSHANSSKRASARRSVWNAQHYVFATGCAFKTGFGDEDSELFQTVHRYCQQWIYLHIVFSRLCVN